MEIHRIRLSKLHQAVFDCDISTVRDLLAKGTSVNATYKRETAFTLSTACLIMDQRYQYDDVERQRARKLIAEMIFNSSNIDPKAKNANKRTALHEAALLGRLDWVHRLLSLGAKINERDVLGCSPFYLAIAYDNEPCLRVMLQHGADVNQRLQDGSTPLHLACKSFAPNCLRLLLAHGCEVNKRDEAGETALMAATSYRRAFKWEKLLALLEITHCLVAVGLDLNACDLEGWSLLERAIKNNNVYAVCVLAENGCDMALKDSSGMSPVQLATSCGANYEVARHLLHYGAKGDSGFIPDVRSWKSISPFHSVLRYINFIRLHQCGRENFLKTSALLAHELLDSTYSSVYGVDFEEAKPSYANHSSHLSSDVFWNQLNDTKRNIKQRVLDLSRCPRSLQDQARLQIRKALGTINIVPKINLLPIPSSMKTFLNLGTALEEASMCETVRLHGAIFANQLQQVKQAIAAGASVHITMRGKSAVELALESNNDTIIKELFNHLTSSRIFQKRSKNTKVVSHRQTSPQEFSDLGDTVLHIVARAGALKYIKPAVLLSFESLSVRNWNGQTSIEEALTGKMGLHTAESILIACVTETYTRECGVAKEIKELKDLGVTLLHLASAAGAQLLVHLLLRCHQLKTSCKDQYGYTPLQLAHSKGREYELMEASDFRPNVRDFVDFILKTQSFTAQHERVEKRLMAHTR